MGTQMIDARKDIVFRDEHYKEKFRIKDGDRIKITVAYDGEEIIKKCRFLDETHMNVGSTCFHMDEFMEKQAQAGNTYEPVPDPMPKLDVVYAEPGSPPVDKEIPLDATALRELLGGQTEIRPVDKAVVMLTAENGNGSFIVCAMDDGRLTSLHPYAAQRYKYEPERCTRILDGEKPSILSALEYAKKQAAAQTPGPKEDKAHTGPER
jgi:hypothetical protein